MKSKIHIIRFLIFISIFLINFNQILASDLIIDAKVVDIIEKGNLVKASGTVNITDGKSIEIKGDEAKYNKLKNTVEITGNVIFFEKSKNYKATSNKITFERDKNIISSLGSTSFYFLDKENLNKYLEVKGENSYFDQNNKILEIKENVFLKDYQNDYKIYSDHIIYFEEKEIIKSLGNTQINYKDEFLIQTKDISFQSSQNKFYSDKETTVTDNLNNKFNLSSFYFDIKENILKAKNLKLNDSENNLLELTNGYVDLNTNEIIGSDFNFKFNKQTFGNSENDPRMVGRYIITNKSETTMKKSSFTTCKIVEGKCPSWSISADEVTHKKEKKRIEYKNTWLKIYDTPIIYFPFFFHPDPSVERQSGFLFPQFINSSNLGFSTQIPYFKVIDKDKDMTISPRVYNDNNLFLQTEYRQAFENSKFTADFSYNNKKDNSNSHFFSSLQADFENSFYEMKIETVSNKDYLKKYQIESPLINNKSVLNSSILYEKYSDDYSFSTSINVIEDLSKSDSDKYEFIFPNYNYNKEINLNNNLFDTLNFNSSGNFRKYNTNVDEADLTNDFMFNSNNHDKLTNLETDFNLLFRNINTYGNLSNTYKEDTDNKFVGSMMLNLKYPLIKNTSSSKSFFTPLASVRYSPNKGLNLKNENTTLINFQDLFMIDRISKKTVETGASATIGFEYKKQDNYYNEKLTLGLGVNFRNNIDEDLPLSSSLGQKTSDLIGYSGINITENLSINYNFSIDQNLSETNYSLVSAIYNGNNFKTSFEYMEKSKSVGDESYLNNFTQLEINKSNSLAFETNKNIDKNLTNYYNLIYEYKNDCLKASVVYNKQFYQEDTVNPGKNIFFKITFIPFGNINTPNIND